MKTPVLVTIILLSTLLLGLIAGGPKVFPLRNQTTEEQWLKTDLSADARDQLVDSANKEPFSTIAPFLLKVLVDCRPFYGINPVSDKPWNDSHLSPRDRTYMMAVSVWQNHMKSRDDPSKAAVMLSLLKKASRDAEKTLLIHYIENDQWCADAESTLLSLSKNKTESMDVRRASVTALLYHGNLNVYMPLAVEIILAHKKGLDRCQAFGSISNQGNRLFTLEEARKIALLSAGFEILAELPKEDLQTGYFVARRLGFILKIENDFAPARNPGEYKGGNGSRDDFFVDTVKNAIEWWTKNKETIDQEIVNSTAIRLDSKSK